MTIRSWKKEFYPKKPSKKMTAREAAEHSLKKWTGLLFENMEKNEVEHGFGGIKDDSSWFDVDASTCALCVKFYDRTEEDHRKACIRCPLSQTLGKPCDFGDRSPYVRWHKSQNALPMIEALTKTLETIDDFVE